MRIRYIKNSSCHCCIDMKKVVTRYVEEKGIEYEECELNDIEEIPIGLKGVPYIEVYYDNGEVRAFQGSTSYENFVEWIYKINDK